MEITWRAAVRIVCLDAAARVLLLQWQDPVGGRRLWEPPGGGIEPGETPLATARRELVEETGLDPDAIVDGSVLVARDVKWNGKRFVGEEPFFLARFAAERPALSGRGLLPDERRNLRGQAWLARDEVAALPDAVEPPTLAQTIARLDPTGPWAP